MVQEEAPTDQTLSFLTNFGIGAAVFMAVLVFYDILRHFFPGHCYCRFAAAMNPANYDYDGSPLQSPSRPPAFPLSWVLPTLQYPLEKLIETHGLDATMFIRFLLTQTRIFFALTIYSCIVLIPTYATGENGDGPNRYRGIERASLANVPDMSPRLWATLVSEIAVVSIILIFLYRDMAKFMQLRIRYRKDNKKTPSNFAILMMDIPPTARDPNYLFSVFNRIFPGQIVAVHPVRDAHHLLSLKARYITAVNKRRRAELSSAASNSPRSHRSEASTPIAFVSSPPTEALSSECPHLDLSNISSPNIQRDNYKQPRKKAKDLDGIEKVDNGNHSVAVTFSASTDFEKKDTPEPVCHIDSARLSSSGGESMGKRPCSCFGPSRKIPRSNRSSPDASPRLRALTRVDSGALMECDRQVERARNVVDDVEKDIEQSCPITHAAFVVFRSKVATTCAVTSPLFPFTGNFKISRAPDPRAINWNRINISRYTTRIRAYISFGVLTAMTLLWTIPSSLIQALGKLEQLGKTLDRRGLPFLKRFVEKNEGFARFLEGILPPILLFLVLLAVPQVMRFVVSFERIPSQIQAENKIRNFLFFFYVMSNFVFQVVIGSFLEKLEELVENPRNLVSLLSESVPQQATFLMKYVLINSFLGSVFGLLNIGRLLFRPFITWRAKTEREKTQADRLFAGYPFAKMYALCMMISLISYVYSTISPIINAVAFLYYSLAYLCTKQLLLYSHRPPFEGGGYLFRDAWTGLLIGLYVHQVSMIGIFSLKLAAVQALLAIISFVFSIWFTIVCRKRFFPFIDHGSLLEQSPTEEEAGLREEIPPGFVNMYVHPGLKPTEILETTNMDPSTAVNVIKSKPKIVV